MLALRAIFLALLAAHPAAAAPRHLIYLHGRIVQEEQSPRPHHPRFGDYELEKILQTFRQRGFTVTGGIRPKGQSPAESADAVAGQVRRLLAAGVPADHVTVLGASMGGEIALLASSRIDDPNVRYAVLGVCLARSEHGRGRFLEVREASDESTADCPPSPSARALLLYTGLSHGFLYRPLPEWVDPVARFASAAR